MSSVASGFQLPFEGGRLLLRERRLWSLAIVPVLLSLVAFSTALGLIIAYAGEIYGWATLWVPSLEVSAWYAWVWVAPARLLLLVASMLCFLAIAGAVLVLAYMLASVLASPFHDALAYRIEQIATGAVRDEQDSGALGTASEILRSMREELRRLVFFLAVVGGLGLFGSVVPGAQLLTGPAIVGFTIFFLPLDYASYTLDRRRFSFRAKRRWLMDHKPVVGGFGVAAFLICLVPGLNFLAMPLLVAGGTLLAVRHTSPPAV